MQLGYKESVLKYFLLTKESLKRIEVKVIGNFQDICLNIV